ncbi:type VII secretion target [Gordonia sp. OPL2]|uniref:type VII secretion target n=1 Tax=Gordonia sp. OPL2 TaxID=2486274 RepID=UPI001655EEDB|nr:type VII secretion target [Gordonia sp. OPL2]
MTDFHVDPAELRTAGSQIGKSQTGADTAATSAAPIRQAAAGLSGTDTARALSAAAGSAESAIEVVQSRIGAWVSILNESADTFDGTDKQSAERLKALGDFNQAPNR